MPKYIAAIDQGTTSTRCILFDHGGQYRRHGPEGTPANLPQAWLGGTRCPGNLGAHRRSDRLCAGKSWSNRQRHRRHGYHQPARDHGRLGKATGKPVHNAIVWQDTRTDGICHELAQDGGQDRLRPKTGLPLATYFSGPKIKWILDNVPGRGKELKRANCFSATWIPGSSGT